MQNMPMRTLGRTGLAVGVIGLGTEYLRNDRQTAIDTIHAAIAAGINYFDVLMPMPDYRDNMGAAFRGLRERAILTCHLGGVMQHGQWGVSRDPAICAEYVDDWLSHLGTEYIDVLNITCVDKDEDFDRIVGPGGVLDLAIKLKKQGKARFIGLSGHETAIANKAITHGAFDVLTQGCNLTWPIAATGLACKEAGVGLVAMKPYAGGELFHPPYASFVTPALAIAHVLAQPGVTTVIPGAANVNQLNDALAYLTHPIAADDLAALAARFDERVRGTCIYCNHCLPCPVGIPIGDVLRALRGLGWGLSYAPAMAAGMATLPQLCTACGDCLDRCPFGVDVPAEMSKAVAAFAPYKQGPG